MKTLVGIKHTLLTTPTAGLPGKQTPYECWTSEKPRIVDLKVFGATVYYLAPGGRFGKKAQKGIYLGPAFDTTGGAIRVYCPETKRVRVTRDVKVIESGIEQITGDITIPVDDDVSSSSESESERQGEHGMGAADDRDNMATDTDNDTESGADSDESGPGEKPIEVRHHMPRDKRGLDSTEITPAHVRQGAAKRASWRRNENTSQNGQVTLGYTRKGKRIVAATEITPADQRRGRAKRTVGSRPTPVKQRVQGSELEGEHAYIVSDNEPTRYRQAMGRDDAEQWAESMR